MKRRALERWLRERGCELDREGSRHSWFINRGLNRRSAVPVTRRLATSLCARSAGTSASNRLTTLESLFRNHRARSRRSRSLSFGRGREHLPPFSNRGDAGGDGEEAQGFVTAGGCARGPCRGQGESGK
jgi:hypothetical protein